MLFRISNLHEKLTHSVMKRMKLLLLAAGLLCSGLTNAQSVNLRLDTGALNGIGTLSHLQVDSIPLIIHNDSSVAFVGYITMGSSINGALMDSIDNVPGAAVYYPTSGDTETIPAHDSILRYLVVTGQNPPFIQGPNGLVVWPVSQFYPQRAHISDSISTVIIFSYPAAINEPNINNLKVYMSGSELLIQGDGEHLLKEVKLYDVTGQVLTQKAITVSGNLDMDSYAGGIYFAEITFADNTRQVFRVFNAR